jgi:beta-glucanase (GH16 family)
MFGTCHVLLCLGLFVAASGQTPEPQIFEEFDGWTGVNSPDGIWRRNGNWNATGGNLMALDNCTITSTYEGEPGGYLILTVRAGVLEGGEIQTWGEEGSDLGYGYYEVRMKVSGISGCCNSFFWKEVNYGPGEIDLEFLTNETWSSDDGAVWCMLHPGNYGGRQSFPFDPSEDFHRYGFLFQEGRIDWTADGEIIQTITDPPTPIPDTRGYIMMNAWTGNANWGGGPPEVDASCIYDWVKFWPDVTSIPSEAQVGVVIGPSLEVSSSVDTPSLVLTRSGICINPGKGDIKLFDLLGKSTGRTMSVTTSLSLQPSQTK